MKIKVKLKDHTSIFQVTEQGITVIGKKAVMVKRTGQVNQAIKGGVLEIVKTKAAPAKPTAKPATSKDADKGTNTNDTKTAEQPAAKLADNKAK